MKKFFIVLFFLTAAFSFGQSVPEGLEWEINDDGKSVTITNYSGNAATVQIPERIQGLPVTVISVFAFFDCINLTNIGIPSSVTDIGVSAFSGCENLTSINIPSSVTDIGDLAFDACESLISITVEGRNSSYTILTVYYLIKIKRLLLNILKGKK